MRHRIFEFTGALQVTEELTSLGLSQDAVEGILALTQLESVTDLEQLLGQDSDAVTEIKSLFALADSAGCSNYLEFDASVVRGLAYYTGVSSQSLMGVNGLLFKDIVKLMKQDRAT